MSESVARPSLPILEQVFRPEYTSLIRPGLRMCDVPNTNRTSDLVEAWQRAGRKTKERLLFVQFLDVVHDVKHKAVREIVADLFLILRRCFMEDDKDKLCRHFEGLRSYDANPEQGNRWYRDIGASDLLDYLVDVVGVPAFDMLGPSLMETYSSFLIMTKLIWEFMATTSDSGCLIRKLDACKPLLTTSNCVQLKRFESDPSTDRYLERVKAIYKDAWRDLLLGPAEQCATCGASAHKLWSCGLCVQEGAKNKTRYCNDRCQKRDWKKHRVQHKSRFDRGSFIAEEERRASVTDELKELFILRYCTDF